VKLRGPDDRELVAAAQGDGPVDAVCRAINDCVGDIGELIEFAVDAAAEGINAVGGVSIRLRERGAQGDDGAPVANDDAPKVTASGFGVHTDIIVATAEAYVAAVNGLIRTRARLMVAEVAA
jgi:2-isopropylmalate synthase